MIDGVYRPRNGVGFGDLGELERVEVLKGPQGTVFGKNTSAGVINVITRRPSYTQSAEGEITVGNYGAWGVSGSYNDALGAVSYTHLDVYKRQMRTTLRSTRPLASAGSPICSQIATDSPSATSRAR